LLVAFLPDDFFVADFLVLDFFVAFFVAIRVLPDSKSHESLSSVAS
jgi:hypothetical protein